MNQQDGTHGCDVCRLVSELRRIATEMRELGVLEYNGIRLGPAPTPPAPPVQPMTEQEVAAAAVNRKRAHYETLLMRDVGDEELARLP